MTLLGSKVDGKVAKLRWKRNRKRTIWIEMRSKQRRREEGKKSPHTTIITISYICQLTSFLTDTVEGSHSNRTRTTSRWPLLAATWMGKLPTWDKGREKENDMNRHQKQIKKGRRRKEVIPHDHHNNIKYISTYLVLNRYSGRITLQ